MRLLEFIGALAILVAIVAAVYFFGGFYSVAATQEDPALVKLVLIKVRTASINHQAADAPLIPLDNPANIQAGAKAFQTRGCLNCHGAPGVEWAKFSEGLSPDPPDLKDVVNERRPNELFWVIKNGINMTGMPSFGKIEVPDQEIWQIVAFLKKLPNVSEADYKSWTGK